VAEVPSGVVTRTSTLPDEPAGATAVSCVADRTVKLVAAVPPKVTAVVPRKLVPVTVTTVPPPVLPEKGDTPVTVGVAAVTCV
jgi:hypothetical protein